MDVEVDQPRPPSGCATASPSSSTASRRAASGGASPASMCPPGCIQRPRRLCRWRTVPRVPTTMAEAVTWVGSACSLVGIGQPVQLGQEALLGLGLPGRRGPVLGSRDPDACTGRAWPWCHHLAQVTGEHRHGVPGDVDPVAGRADVEHRAPARELTGHQFGPPEDGRPVGTGRALGRSGGRVLVDPDVGPEDPQDVVGPGAGVGRRR